MAMCFCNPARLFPRFFLLSYLLRVLSGIPRGELSCVARSFVLPPILRGSA
jgi:hypothetical protein